MTIGKVFSEKKFQLSIVSDADPKFNVTNGRYEDMLLNQMFSGCHSPLRMGNYRNYLDKTGALNLNFEVSLIPLDV
jgi:hypothetical protein